MLIFSPIISKMVVIKKKGRKGDGGRLLQLISEYWLNIFAKQLLFLDCFLAFPVDKELANGSVIQLTFQ